MNLFRETKDFKFDSKTMLKQALQQGTKEPAYTEKINENGTIAIDPVTGRKIMQPRLVIPVDTYILWFHKVFPEGRIGEPTISRKEPLITKKTVIEGDKTVVTEEVIYPATEVMVGLYKNLTDEKPFVTGVATYEPKRKSLDDSLGEVQELDHFKGAASLAFIDAMRRGGFGVDIDWNKVLEDAPSFLEGDPLETLGTEVKSVIPFEEMKTEEATRKKAKKEKEDKEDPQKEAINLMNLFGSSKEEVIPGPAEEEKEDVAPSVVDTNEVGSTLFKVLDTAGEKLKEEDGKTIAELAKTNRGLLRMVAEGNLAISPQITEESKEACRTYWELYMEE